MPHVACRITPSLTAGCSPHITFPLTLLPPILASFSFLNRPCLLLSLLLCLHFLFTQLAPSQSCISTHWHLLPLPFQTKMALVSHAFWLHLFYSCKVVIRTSIHLCLSPPLAWTFYVGRYFIWIYAHFTPVPTQHQIHKLKAGTKYLLSTQRNSFLLLNIPSKREITDSCVSSSFFFFFFFPLG